MVGTRRLINMECTGCLQYTDKTSGEWVCPQATWVLLKMEARLDNSLDMAKPHLMLVLCRVDLDLIRLTCLQVKVDPLLTEDKAQEE